LRRRIESGELAPGDALPSMTALAEEFAVAKVTIQKAVAVLKVEGLVTGVPGWAVIVSGPED
jgi:DNA-binding GntR family transcriptional regulator